MSTKCCEAMEKILETYDGPFFVPIHIDSETLTLKSGRLAVRVYNMKKGTNKWIIDRKSTKNLFLNFCPVCGKKLDE